MEAAIRPTRWPSALALALVLALAAPLPASADEADRVSDPVVKTHTYMASEGDGDAPVEEYVENGVTYELVGTEDEDDPDWEPETSTFTRSKTVQCAPAELENTRASFASTWSIDEDGFSGEIPLVDVDAVEVVAEQQYQAEQVVTYDCPDNDVSRIPGSREFVLETGNAVELGRAGVSWDVVDTDAAGLPSRYRATVVYRGVDTATVVDHYDVTATYAGEIEATGDERRLVTATYRAVLPEPEAEPEPAPEPEPEPEFPWAAVVGGAAAAAVAAAGGAVVFIRWRNVRLVRIENGKAKMVCGLHATRTSTGGLAVEIPARHDLTKGDCRLILRPDIAGAPSMKVSHLGAETYFAKPGSTVDLAEGAVGG